MIPQKNYIVLSTKSCVHKIMLLKVCNTLVLEIKVLRKEANITDYCYCFLSRKKEMARKKP